MDAVVFPFLALPQKSQLIVLQTMELLEIVSFSFFSEKTKDLTISLNLTAEQVVIDVGRVIVVSVVSEESKRFWIDFEFFKGIDVAETDGFIRLPVPDTINVDYSKSHVYAKSPWRKPEYEFKNWLQHVLTVFHHSTIDELIFENDCDRFDVSSIADALKGYPIGELGTLHTEGRARLAARKALEVFPNTSRIFVGDNLFEESLSIQKILIKNYDEMWVDYPITLNDLLIINASVTIFECDWPATVINRFLKLWIRGSHSKLEHLVIQCETMMNEGNLLKNIMCNRVPANQQREFRPSVSMSHQDDMIVHGGCDIKRRDGTVATITVENKYESSEIKMFVWFK